MDYNLGDEVFMFMQMRVCDAYNYYANHQHEISGSDFLSLKACYDLINKIDFPLSTYYAQNRTLYLQKRKAIADAFNILLLLNDGGNKK